MPRSHPRQLSLLKAPDTSHGGSLRQGRRKLARPIDPRRPLHVTLRSSRAKGAWSMLHPRHAGVPEGLAREAASKQGVRLHRFANVGNHLHLLVQARDRKAFQAFLREFSGRLAMRITGARKGRPVGRFWDQLAWSRVVSWGRDFETTTRYLIKNLFEAAGLYSGSDRRAGRRVIRIGRTGAPPGSLPAV